MRYRIDICRAAPTSPVRLAPRALRRLARVSIERRARDTQGLAPE